MKYHLSEVNKNAHNKMMSRRHFILPKLHKIILYLSQYSMRISLFLMLFFQPNIIMLSLGIL